MEVEYLHHRGTSAFSVKCMSDVEVVLSRVNGNYC